MTKYFGDFGDLDDVLHQFRHDTYSLEANKPLENTPTDEQVLYANYGGGSYEGAAIVIFVKDGQLWEVNGSHCSCYGLEGQWEPEETSWEALSMRQLSSYDYSEDEIKAFNDLVQERLALSA